MKDVYKIATMILFAIWLIFLWRGSSLFAPEGSGVLMEENAGTQKAQDSEVADTTDKYAALIDGINSPFAISRYKPLFDRNIFIKPEAPPEQFSPEKLKVVSIGANNLPFMYNGFIQKQDGTMIGQINWSGKTYFAKKGEKFKDYKILEINSKLIKAENRDGQLILEYKKPVKSKELIAKLYDSMNDKTFEVKKGEEYNGYKVLDIKPGSVVLYGQNQEWVINKGR
ncbi:MAG: hypothetical protein WC512_01875 [Candidatus Omnitrophota bacterium]